MLYPDTLPKILDILYHASFVDHQPVHEKECLLALLVKAYGQGTAKEIIQKVVQSPRVDLDIGGSFII